MVRRLLLAALLGTLLVAPAGATWSIVVVNRRSGEVAIGSATCIASTNLLRGLPVIVVGKGGGVIQASGDFRDLVVIADGLRRHLSPAEILELVRAAEPAPNQLQTGIVALDTGPPVTFTGRNVGRAKLGVVGEVGDLAYAIQGNVLAGEEVVLAAEAALLGTEGDLGQRLLAAMGAARDFGGDGRCSCDLGRPDGCGSPPEDFEKSAHVGFLFLSRIGDPEATCAQGVDCADQPAYLKLNVRGMDAQEGDPDPVDQLEDLYAAWREARRGRPDGILSQVDAVDSLPADGLTKRIATVRLVDLDGLPLDHGGAEVRVAAAGGARAHILLGPVADRGDGRYSFTLTSTTRVGTDRFVITADDGFLKATLYPFLEIRSEPPAALHAGRDRISAARGGSVPFGLREPAHPGSPYVILASAGGTEPGIPLTGGAVLPLALDPWFRLSLRLAGDPAHLPGTLGILDAQGRAEAAFVAPPGALAPLLGARLYWAGLVSDEDGPVATNPVGFDVVP